MQQGKLLGSDTGYEVIIIGAGVAGLSAAWALRERNAIVLEAAERAGGRLQGVLHDDLPLSLGGHMVPGHGSRTGELITAMGLDTSPLPSRLFALAEGGRHYQRTPQALLPLAMRLTLRERAAFMRLGLALRLGAQRSITSTRRKAGEDADAALRRTLSYMDDRTLAAYVGALPPRIADLLAVLTERTGADPFEMSAGHGLRSFANVWASSDHGANLRGGAARLPASLTKALGPRMRLGHEVRHVRVVNEGVRVAVQTPSGQEVITARCAILATPAPVTRDIAPFLPTSLRAALAEIRYGPFLSLSLLAQTGGTHALQGTYATLTPDMPFSVAFNHGAMLTEEQAARGISLFMLFRGARGAAREMELDDEALSTRWLAGFEQLLPELRGRIRASAIGRWPLGAPYAAPGDTAARLALEAAPPPIALAGDYLDAPNMEAAAQAGLRAAKRVERWLAKQAGGIG